MNMMNNYGQQNPFENPMKGTTTVALRFKDGVVVATDRRASAGTFVASKRAKKLHQLNDYTVATIAGLVADAQYLVNLTKANLNLYELNRGYPPTTKMAGNLLASVLYEQFRSYMPFYVAMLVCGLDKYGPHVYNLDASIKLGLRALSTSISRDTATGNGMDALVVNKDGIRWLTEEEIKKILEEL